jgi:hypothetical protein
MGAGAAISDGKNILALTATSAIKKINIARNGAMYSRMIAIFVALGAGEFSEN